MGTPRVTMYQKEHKTETLWQSSSTARRLLRRQVTRPRRLLLKSFYSCQDSFGCVMTQA
jgi:hypothetical protein